MSDQQPEFTPKPAFDLALSRAIDRATLQLEAAIEAGDDEMVVIFRRELDKLEALIPEARDVPR